MVKYSFVFLVIFLIAMLSYLSQEAAISVAPGWHTIIYPPSFFLALSLFIWIGIAALIYYILERNEKVVRHRIFLLHTILSLFAFPTNAIPYSENYYVARVVLIALYFLFALGQIIFLIGVVKAKKVTSALKDKFATNN
ncbi:MAG: hypothetical protein QM726_10890 [Chitinophagaceae bacterium]